VIVPSRAKLGQPLSAPWKLVLAIEVVLTRHRVLVRLRREGLHEALDYARSRPAGASGGDASAATVSHRLARGVALTLWALPGDGRCLARSLVLMALLARRGLGGRLLIGVRPGEAFGAHAWVEREGRPLLEPGGGEFQTLIQL